MAKPKVEEEGEKSDGLEIISIGSLYSGPWDKKYWSSSRGKDRYPYPVGYDARRAYYGNIYKMEIREGDKGPVFVITSSDGCSCSGQTPDIAWEKFQRTTSRNVKIWHGKRFSCKIDGIEFFGFRNPFVQRLLRELVANVNGIAEKNLVSSSFCDATSGKTHNDRSVDASALPDLLQHLASPQITKKRNKRCKITNSNSLNNDGFKSSQPGNSTPIVEASNSTSMNSDFHRTPGELPATVYLESVAGEKNNYLKAKNGLPLKSMYSGHPREKDFRANEESKLAGLENCKSIKEVGNLSAEVKPLCSSEDIRTEGLKSPVPVEDKPEDAFASKDSQSVCDICVPDSVDFVQGTLDKSPQSSKEDRIMADVDLSEKLMSESNPEEEIGTSNSNASYGKSGFDSVGQEVAKTMMTVFLPQAIPLLKRNSREKKNYISHSQNFPCFPKPCEGDDNADYPLKDQFSDSYPLLCGSEHIESVVPDSFDDDHHYRQHDKKPVVLPSKVEAVQPSLDGDPYPFCSSDMKESLVCQVEMNGIKNILCHDEQQSSLRGRTQYTPNLSQPVLPCMTSTKRVLSEENQVACRILDENSLASKIHYEEEDLKLAPNSTEALTTSVAGPRGRKSSMQPSKETISRAGTAETDIASITHAAKRVYVRKKFRNEASTSGSYSAPLSESIVCRSSKHSLEATGNLLDSDILQKLSSVEKPYRSYPSGAATKIEGQIDAVEKHQPHLDRGLLGHKNVLDIHVSSSSQNPDISNGNEDQCNLHLKLERNLMLKNDLGNIVELVGCYFHPIPVSSLMLTTKGNEIYVAALCGLQLQKEKTLFLYKLKIDEPRIGWPSFVGHFSLILPSLTDMFGREITVERSGLQFTPDGKCLLLLGSIKTPYCRAGRVDCLCSTCTSNCFEPHTVKIVQVKSGYVSVLVNVRAVDCLQCMLVSEPNHLIAAGDSGRLHLWTMNSTWSVPMEEFVVQANDCISPCIVELKTIPKSASLVIGHNGFGEFTLWDISQRIFVSRFSATSTSVYQCLPICLFSWQRETHGLAYTNAEEVVSRIMNATKFWSSERKDHSFNIVEAEDIAIWLLISTAIDSNAQHDHISCDSVGQWRLALLARKMLIVGSALDPRAAAMCTSAGYGIIGTLDGLVYKWESTTGLNLGTLHHFEGGSVTCIAADNSSSGLFAVASDRGELLVYRQSTTAS